MVLTIGSCHSVLEVGYRCMIVCVVFSVALRSNLSNLHKSAVGKNGKLQVTFLPVEKQTDGHNCGVYAIAFAAEILAGLSPIDSRFAVTRMRYHLIKCLENEKLTPFPKTNKRKQEVLKDATNIIEI